MEHGRGIDFHGEESVSGFSRHFLPLVLPMG